MGGESEAWAVTERYSPWSLIEQRRESSAHPGSPKSRDHWRMLCDGDDVVRLSELTVEFTTRMVGQRER